MIFITDKPGGKGEFARHGELGLFRSHYPLLRNAGDSSESFYKPKDMEINYESIIKKLV